MKNLSVVFIGLLCTLVWAEDPDTESEAEEEPTTVSPPLNIFTFSDDEYAVALEDKVNWYQAELLCASQGYTLVSFRNLRTQRNIESWLMAMAEEYLPLVGDEPIWTSGSNQANNADFIWQGSGHLVLYDMFVEPPNRTISTCIGFNAITGYWSTHSCRDRHFFMCQKVATEKC